jgi:hypothetical protein
LIQVSVTEVIWRKIDDTTAKNLLAGASWTFTPVDNAGQPVGPSIVIDDCQAASAASCAGADLDSMGGAFKLRILGTGTYHLVETRAPVGFRLNTTPIPVTITGVVTSTPGIVTTITLPDVVNVQQPVPLIPFTGGLGTDALTITGAALLALMLAMIAVQLIRRRRNGLPELQPGANE